VKVYIYHNKYYWTIIKITKMEVQCGLQMSVNAIKKILINELELRGITYNISNDVAIRITAIIEYLVAEIMELGGNVTLNKNRKRLSIDHVILAIQTDSELNKLYNSTNNIISNKPKDETPRLSTWTCKILTQIHPDTNISRDAKRFIDKLVYDTVKKFSDMFPLNEKDININDMIDLVIPNELSKHAKNEMNKAIAKFNSK